jgi:hypothetical protein
MKINEKTRFPHPVLSSENNDYLIGEFDIQVVTVEEKLTTDQVTVDVVVSLAEQSLRELIVDGHAGVGFFVTCLDTYYSRLVPIGLEDRRFSFEPGALVGSVSFLPMVWAKKNIGEFDLTNCHAEFGGGAMSLEIGSVLAVGEAQRLTIGREKLAEIESIFSVVQAPDLEDDELLVNPDSDKIQLLVASNIYQDFNRFRGLPHGKPIVLNSAFVPAVMEVLDLLRQASSEYEGRRWFRIFKAKCDYLGVDLESPNLWRDAQRLLNSPFGNIRMNSQLWEGE